MSTISAGTTSGTALVSAGNTDGTIQLRVNGTTPSVTLATTGAIGVGSTPGYGTSGQVLVSGGSAAAPSWATPASGLTFISTTTASGSANTLDITSGFSSTYDDYLIIAENITIGVGTNDAVVMRFYTASTLRTTLYMYARFFYVGGSSSGSQSTSATYIESSYSFQSTTVGTAQIWIRNANSTTAGRTQVQTLFSATDSTNSTGNFLTYSSGANQSASALTGLRFYWPGDVNNTFLTGTFRLYGIAKS